MYHASDVSGEFVLPRVRRVLDHRAAGRWIEGLTVGIERRFFKANTFVLFQIRRYVSLEPSLQTPHVEQLSRCSLYEKHWHIMNFAFVKALGMNVELIVVYSD